jgi:hypothetical protein
MVFFSSRGAKAPLPPQVDSPLSQRVRTHTFLAAARLEMAFSAPPGRFATESKGTDPHISGSRALGDGLFCQGSRSAAVMSFSVGGPSSAPTLAFSAGASSSAPALAFSAEAPSSAPAMAFSAAGLSSAPRLAFSVAQLQRRGAHG